MRTCSKPNVNRGSSLFLLIGVGLLGMGVFLGGCSSPSRQGTTWSASITPTPTPEHYALDVSKLGLRLWVPRGWQAVQGEGPSGPWIFLVPLGRYSDEDAMLFPPPLLDAEEEGILLPPEPPYMLAYVYLRPATRPWKSREVYFALDELGILVGETLEVLPSPTAFQSPRGAGWYVDFRLSTSEESALQARLTILNTPFPQWTFVFWGMASPDSWSALLETYQQVLLRVDFVQAPSVVESDS